MSTSIYTKIEVTQAEEFNNQTRAMVTEECEDQSSVEYGISYKSNKKPNLDEQERLDILKTCFEFHRRLVKLN